MMVEGPITGGRGRPFTATAADLVAAGYTEKEFFFAGEATAYVLQGEMSMDGKWRLMEASTAPFKSRLLVRRPMDPLTFNGTVVVEWLNVSGGADGDPGFMYNAAEILREGYAFVGVSAQVVGVEGGGFSRAGAGAVPLKQYDLERYGSLRHPGDEYSYDIFTQAARVIRGAGGASVLEGLEPERVIGYGESQSAMRMVSYVNGVHPLVEQYDGFFIHSRGAGGAPFEGGRGFQGMRGSATFIRDDLAEPVFQYQTETDVTGRLAFLPARQPDSDRLRTWEVAGTAHADRHILDFNAKLRAGGSRLAYEGVNDGPKHFVIKAALHSLDRWMRSGTEPARVEPLRTDASGSPVKDEHGNTLGGVRSPHVDVPIATHSGDPPPGGNDGGFRFLFGSTTPFTRQKLMTLYPTHEDYVAKVAASARRAREAGFLLEPEEQAMVAKAEAAPIPN
jgi:hypothetical protein